MIELTVDDLKVFEPDIDTGKAEQWIVDALAWAYRAAPCLKDPDTPEDTLDAAKAVIRSAILRWNDSGTGAVVTQQAGQFSQTVDNRNPRKSLYWPSEIRQLSSLCGKGRAFTIDLAPDMVSPSGPTLGWTDNWWGSL